MAALVILGIYLLVLVAVGRVAERYGRRAWPWVLLALVIGVFTFIPLLLVGKTQDQHLREIEAEEAARTNAARGSTPAVSQLRELAELKDSGVLTSEEFEQKRATLLDRI